MLKCNRKNKKKNRTNNINVAFVDNIQNKRRDMYVQYFNQKAINHNCEFKPWCHVVINKIKKLDVNLVEWKLAFLDFLKVEIKSTFNHK